MKQVCLTVQDEQPNHGNAGVVGGGGGEGCVVVGDVVDDDGGVGCDAGVGGGGSLQQSGGLLDMCDKCLSSAFFTGTKRPGSISLHYPLTQIKCKPCNYTPPPLAAHVCYFIEGNSFKP